MNTPKVSVIVPVYKVEPYLRRGLDSLMRQTCRELEIILVDDGSPDRCGEICDAYVERYERVRVIHQPNSGVSAARNAGLEAAAGEWIGWMDSDDWIEPDMFDYLLEGAQRTGADIVVCGRWEEYRDKKVFRGWKQETLLDTEQALKALLENDTMQNFLWDKLWRRELFDGLRFPEGRTFEDIAVMHRLFMKTSCVACLPEGKYHYFQRPGSIVGDTSLENRINHYLAAKQRLEELAPQWPQFWELLESQCVASSITIWCAYTANPREEQLRYGPQLREIAAFAGEHYRQALEYMKLGPVGRAVLRLTPHAKWWAFTLARFLGWFYKCKHGREL